MAGLSGVATRQASLDVATVSGATEEIECGDACDEAARGNRNGGFHFYCGLCMYCQDVSKDFELNDAEALKVLTALGDPGRFEIFRRVAEAPGLTLTDLKSGKAASTTSYHIKLLVKAGVLQAVREGKHSRYNVRGDTLASFTNWCGAQAELATLNKLAEYPSDNPS